MTNLPPGDVARLAAWIAEYQAQLWDEQIEADLKAGRLERMVQEAETAKAAGRSASIPHYKGCS